jgi:hypothetical protein
MSLLEFRYVFSAALRVQIKYEWMIFKSRIAAMLEADVGKTLYSF